MDIACQEDSKPSGTPAPMNLTPQASTPPSPHTHHTICMIGQVRCIGVRQPWVFPVLLTAVIGAHKWEGQKGLRVAGRKWK